MTITVDTMRERLITLDELHRTLATTEPMRAQPFTVGDAIRFEADRNFHHGGKARDSSEPVPVYAILGIGQFARRYQLSLATLETLCTTFGFKTGYASDCPAELLVPHLNYWYREGLFVRSRKGRDFQFLVNGDDLAVAFTKQGLTPFSNLALLDTAVEQIRARYGPDTEVLADFKSSHSLTRTRVRLIVPGAGRLLDDTGTADDRWSLGTQISNSLTGAGQTSIEGYLFRWVCTNGQTDSHTTSGAYTRRKDGDPDEVYAWARAAVNEALSGLDGALDAVQRLTQVHIDGSVSDTLRDVFEHYRIPITQRPRIISNLEHYDGDITMYVIMNAITQAANDNGLDPQVVDNLLRIGGDVPWTGEQRCGACHRLMHQH